jgi:inner membrane protein
MSSPVAHCLLGLSVARLGRPRRQAHVVAWYAFGALAGEAADLDFIPGLLAGNINQFHHDASHSIVAAFLFGLLMSGLLWPLWRAPARIFVVGSLGYLTHVVLDLFCAIPGVTTPGLPLFWPFSDAHWKAGWQPFLGIHHGAPGDSLAQFWERVVSWHNLSALSREALAFFPIALVIWFLTSTAAPAHRPAEK